jgi:two-component system response regulator YesN
MVVKKKVLVVDDEPGIVEGIKNILELSSDYEVLCTFDAEEAFEKFKAFDPRLVITDIKMPKKDGFWLVNQIRQIDKNVPIVMMSGFTSATQEEIDSSEHQHFITKPDDIVNILEVVKSLIE